MGTNGEGGPHGHGKLGRLADAVADGIAYVCDNLADIRRRLERDGDSLVLDRLLTALRSGEDPAGPVDDLNTALQAAGDALGVYGKYAGRCRAGNKPARDRPAAPGRGGVPVPGRLCSRYWLPDPSAAVPIARLRASRCAPNGYDVGDVLAEIGKNLADRWLTLLVLPGALYLAVLGAAHAMGQGHAFDVPRVVHQVSMWATSSAAHSTAALVIVLVAIVLGSAAAGVMAQAVGSLIENLWLAAGWRTWPAPLRLLADHRLQERQKRWNEAHDSYLSDRDAAARARAMNRIRNQGRTRQTPPIDLTAARERMTRISPEYPGRPTWIGDRIDAVTVRLNRDYDLDLATVWPSLWLVMPDRSPYRGHGYPPVPYVRHHPGRLGRSLPHPRCLVVARPARVGLDRHRRLPASPECRRHLRPHPRCRRSPIQLRSRPPARHLPRRTP